MTEKEMRKHRVCFTGHRPEKLSMTEYRVKAVLLSEIAKAIQDEFNVFISGMSRGVDIWAAQTVLELRKEFPNIKLICASPYKGFEKQWSYEWQKQYSEIMCNADLVRFICSEYSYKAYQIRNEWMVDHSARVIAIWNGEKSGTKNTIDYAQKNKVPVINIYKGNEQTEKLY